MVANMNPQDQNTYVGPPPRAIDPNAPQDPYLASQAQPAPAPYDQPQPVVPPANQVPLTPPSDPNAPIQPIIEPVQSPNDYNTPQLSAQIQMAQQAGAQAVQGQTVSAQMMAQQNPQQNQQGPQGQPGQQDPNAPQAQPGDPAQQVYKAPLVVSNSVTRAFAYIAILTIIVAVVNFIVKQFASEFSSSSVYATIVTILQRINTIALFARIAVVGFAVAATVIRVYNPHPYNTKNAIAGWVFAILSLVALMIFR